MEITIKELRDEHARLGNLIAAYERQLIVPRLIVIPEVKIHLLEGESYGGYLFGDDVDTGGHHVILLPGELANDDWDESLEWARSESGTLPSQQEWRGELPSQREQSLLRANLPKEFQPTVYWSNEVNKNDSSFARCQYFGTGFQYGTRKSARLRARRVRRVKDARTEVKL